MWHFYHAGCYLVISVAYVVGFLMKDSISCREFDNNKVSVSLFNAQLVGCVVFLPKQTYILDLHSLTWACRKTATIILLRVDTLPQ